MSPRAYANVLLSFGPYPVFVKLYSVAAERRLSLPQVHAHCGGELTQQYVCAADGAVVPKVAIAKQVRLPDGSTTTLSEDDLKRAEPETGQRIELLECVPQGSLDPAWLGKAIFLGPDQESGIDGYIALVDALTAAGTSAIGMYYTRTRDQLVVIQPYRERGLLLREVFHADEIRPLDEVELPRSIPQPTMTEAFGSMIARSRKDRFDPAAYRDGYPERLLRAAEERARAGSAPVSLLKAGRERAAKKAAPLKAKATKAPRTTDAPSTALPAAAPANANAEEADGRASRGEG